MAHIQVHAYTWLGQLCWNACVIQNQEDGPLVGTLVSGQTPVPAWVGDDARDVAWLACHEAGAALARGAQG